MSQHYSDPSRADDPYALLDVEVFGCDYSTCPQCDEIIMVPSNEQAFLCSSWHESTFADLSSSMTFGWFYWYCFPGCLPEGEPIGPYESEDAAIQAAQEDACA